MDPFDWVCATLESEILISNSWQKESVNSRPWSPCILIEVQQKYQEGVDH